MMSRVIQIIFFLLIVKPIVFIVLGLNIRGRNNLPQNGPAVIAANHNSHLDTMVLMSLYPLSQLYKVRPVAAADYFLKNRFLKWFSLNCIGIIPLVRKNNTDRESLFTECHQALDANQILIVFPEGSRGAPGELSTLKKGLYHLVKEREDTSITPVIMHGLGKSLPNGEALLVPFNCDVIIGDKLTTVKTSDQFINQLSQRFEDLQEYCITKHKS
jgi:1-acyl-sn-glycerol-3-phosphate acyltransferase